MTFEQLALSLWNQEVSPCLCVCLCDTVSLSSNLAHCIRLNVLSDTALTSTLNHVTTFESQQPEQSVLRGDIMLCIALPGGER